MYLYVSYTAATGNEQQTANPYLSYYLQQMKAYQESLLPLINQQNAANEKPQPAANNNRRERHHDVQQGELV